MSSNKLDTSWFDLKNYDSLRYLSILGWIDVIETRFNALDECNNIYDKRFYESIKLGYPIVDFSEWQNNIHSNRVSSNEYKHSFSTASVNSLSTFNLWKLTRHLHNPIDQFDVDLNHVCGLLSKLDRTHNKTYLALEPYEINIKNEFYQEDDDVVDEAYVKINLRATDAQIKRDLDVWLEKYRDKINSKINEPQNDTAKDKKDKKTYTQVDFKQWILHRVIPYIDLLIVEKYEQIEYRDDKLINMLFNDFIAEKNYNGDLKGKLRKTKEVANSLLKTHMHRTLSAQVLGEKLARREL